MRAIVVVPTCREAQIRRFLDAWAAEFSTRDDRTVEVYVVEDNPEPAFDLSGCTHYSHQDIERDLGEFAWIVPRHTDCVRSYGIWKAWQATPDLIVTMDDDVRPSGTGFLDAHAARLEAVARCGAWLPTIGGIKPRGLPYARRYRERKIVLSHGLWEGDVDLDAVTELGQGKRYAADLLDQAIPPGLYFPMCGMNLAWRPELTPALYFGLQGAAYPFDRFGDIWAGLFVKKICDHLGLGVWSGSPHVRHERVSNVWANLRKELPGLEINEWLWMHVDAARLGGATVGACYEELADRVGELYPHGAYWGKLAEAMRLWTWMFQ